MNDKQPSRRLRVSLTGRDLSTNTGAALLERLEQVATDGLIADEELPSLAAWLDEAASVSEVPGIHFLREEVSGILADGIVSDPERRLLRDAILRVLPVTERARAKARFGEAAAREREARQKESLVAAELATSRQIEYIQALGGSCPESASKQEASGIIEGLLATRPTVRQRMVLRFWNRLDLLGAGVEGVSAWLDRWYAEDPDRIEAWALWKRESGDQGHRLSEYVDRVPLGGGAEYLARVKGGRADAAGVRPTRATDLRHEQLERGTPWGKVGLIGLGLLALLAVVLMLLR
jgi:hypothetical protein